MEGRRHCVCRVQFDGDAVFVAWQSGDQDGFLRDQRGRLVVARTSEALAAVARPEGDPTDYNFDRIRAWCAAPDGAGVDCPAFLNAWNFLDDLAGLHSAADTPYTRLSRGAAACYDKLFWGNNLPAVTPPGERFEPAWRVEELDEVRRVMEAGLGLLAAELHEAGRRA